MRYNNVIKELSSDILLQWGFDFDGTQYVNKMLPDFKVMISDTGYYLVGENNNRIDISNTHQLFSVYLGLSDIYARSKRDEIKSIDDLNNVIKSFLCLISDQEISVGMATDNNIPHLVPMNEYTYTLSSGVQSEFEIHYTKSGEQFTERLLINAACVSYDFLLDLTEADSIDDVKVKLIDGSLRTYYGLGLAFEK